MLRSGNWKNLRKGPGYLTTMAAGLAVVSGIAVAQIITCPTGPNGLCVGTQQDDRITGTSGSDDIPASAETTS
jgi:hypothetical protein